MLRVRIFCFGLCVLANNTIAQVRHFPNTYHQPEDVNRLLRSWAEHHEDICRLTELARSPGSIPVLALEVAAKPEGAPPPDSRTSLLVTANLEGVHHVGTEAALAFIQHLIDGYGKDEQVTDLLETATVYAAPMLNPDGMSGFFSQPKHATWTNATPADDDGDGRIDEDGPDDLNGDGLITLMRVPDPNGEWIIDPDEPRLLRPPESETDPAVRFSLHIEGRDDDNDGRFNEDPIGGVRLDRNFPHHLDYHRGTVRGWPDAARETEALLEFMGDRPNIGVVLNLSRQNGALALLHPPLISTGDPVISVSAALARILDVEAGQTLPRSEILQKMEAMGLSINGMDISSELSVQISGLDSLPTVHPGDREFLEDVYSRYGDMQGIDLSSSEILPGSRDWGDFSVYCALRYGAAVVGSGIWSIPRSAGENRFRFWDDDPVKSVISNTLNQEALAWADSHPQEKGFIPWTRIDHPNLGEVEVGGFVLFFLINPQPEVLERTINPHLIFFMQVLDHLPRLKIDRVQVTPMPDQKYRIRATISNPGWFPTATAQGLAFRSSYPFVARIRPSDGQMIWSGEPFEEFPAIAPGGVQIVEWIVQGPRGSTLPLWISSLKVGTVRTVVELR